MIKYYVNEEKRLVIAVLNGTTYDVINKISKMTYDNNFLYHYSKKYLMPNSFKSVVVCDPKDDFDVETGKAIAKKRVMDRYYQSFDKRMKLFIKDVDGIYSKVLKYKNILTNKK